MGPKASSTAALVRSSNVPASLAALDGGHQAARTVASHTACRAIVAGTSK